MWGATRLLTGTYFVSYQQYINYLHFTIKYSEVHHLADNTNLLNFNSSVKFINNYIKLIIT